MEGGGGCRGSWLPCSAAAEPQPAADSHCHGTSLEREGRGGKGEMGGRLGSTLATSPSSGAQGEVGDGGESLLGLEEGERGQLVLRGGTNVRLWPGDRDPHPLTITFQSSLIWRVVDIGRRGLALFSLPLSMASVQQNTHFQEVFGAPSANLYSRMVACISALLCDQTMEVQEEKVNTTADWLDDQATSWLLRSSFCSLIPLSLGVLSCLSTLIILLMYACARLEVLTWRFSSDGPVSILEFLRPFPLVRLSQTVPPEPPLLRPSSIAEFFLFLPANKPPTPPSLRWLPFKLSREGLDRVCGPDSEADRTLSFPFLRLMGKSLNHFAMAVERKGLKLVPDNDLTDAEI
ncbi:hypothetical protein INR49_005516 [Caranx melampygus]|nr:hypothetical protein INR49_005516 [Caranx melampygus]